MRDIIAPIISNLQRGKVLFRNLDNSVYADKSVGPYHSSIGGHLRHILDIFDCIFDGADASKVDLTARKRNELAEENTQVGEAYLERIIDQLSSIERADPNTQVAVWDDLGLGMVKVNYTLGSALCQAHSHAIHHFACIGYVLEQLGVEIPDARFGYNPTTPDVVK